jgi:hypothetical protein
MSHEVAVEPMLAFLFGYGMCALVIVIVEIGRWLNRDKRRRP